MRPSFAAFADELQKMAEEKKSPAMDIAKVIGGGLLGFGAGTAAGIGLGHLGNKAYKHLTGKSIPTSGLLLAAPLLGTGAGITYAVHKSREQEKIRRALQDQADPSKR